ncbi:MAG: N-acetylmuramoyl-L-alanine amidase family protein [Candidatus Kryptoniota bacterium]
MCRKYLFLLLIVPTLCSAQAKIVPLYGIKSTPIYISGFEEKNHAYISLNELAASLSLQILSLPSTGKVSVFSKNGSILFTPNNSFIVVSNRKGSSAYQMPLPVLVANRLLYVPIKYCSKYFSIIADGTLAYDEAEGQLTFYSSVNVSPIVSYADAEEKENGAVIRVRMQALPAHVEAALTQNILYLTIMPATGNIPLLNSIPSNPVFHKVMAVQNPGSLQLSFFLQKQYVARQVTIDSSNLQVVVSLFSNADVRKIYSDEVRKKLSAEKENWKLDVIVIDAGHGGRDPGAIGVFGTEEKNVTLAIAKDLKRYIEQKLKGIKVVMTRDNDSFVELDKRGEIANEVGGKLFISIHCNSMPRKPNSANGLEVYFLRPGRTEEAIRIAAQENAAIKYENDYEKRYKAYDTDNIILTSMAHSAYVKYSEQLADLIAQEVPKVAAVSDNGVSQAGFYVLVGASMPSVLIETGYLSNPSEERYLRSNRGQEAIARGIANAIVKFKNEYEKTITEN